MCSFAKPYRLNKYNQEDFLCLFMSYNNMKIDMLSCLFDDGFESAVLL